MRKKLMLFVAIIVGIASFILYKPAPSYKTKEIVSAETRFPMGDLADYIEFVGHYDLVYTEVHMTERIFYDAKEELRLRTHIKLIKEGLADDNPSGLRFAGGRLAAIELLDENNSVLAEMRLDEDDKQSFCELLSSPQGTIGEFIFVINGWDDDSEPLNWFRCARKFKPLFTGKIISSDLKETFGSISSTDNN